MAYLDSIAIEPAISKLQIKQTVVLLTATILIQFIMHLIPPVNQVPLGAILLPMFYIPLIAVVFYKFHVGLLIAILGPVLTFTLTGSPKLEIASILTLELIVFVSVFTFLLRNKKLNKLNALISILFAKLISLAVFSTFLPGEFSTNFFAQSFVNAIPGIIILSLMSLLVLKIKDRN